MIDRDEQKNTVYWDYFSSPISCAFVSSSISLNALCPTTGFTEWLHSSSTLSKMYSKKNNLWIIFIKPISLQQKSLYPAIKSEVVIWLQSRLKIANNQLCMNPGWHGCWIILQQGSEWKLKTSLLRFPCLFQNDTSRASAKPGRANVHVQQEKWDIQADSDVCYECWPSFHMMKYIT